MGFLLNSEEILAPNILGRKLNIKHRGFDVGMSHQVHQSGQGDAGAHHITSKGVAEAMRVGMGNPCADAMVAKQRAKAGGGHGSASMGSFEGNKQVGGAGERSFQLDIELQDIDDDIG